jgi:hypothetical protein
VALYGWGCADGTVNYASDNTVLYQRLTVRDKPAYMLPLRFIQHPNKLKARPQTQACFFVFFDQVIATELVLIGAAVSHMCSTRESHIRLHTKDQEKRTSASPVGAYKQSSWKRSTKMATE